MEIPEKKASQEPRHRAPGPGHTAPGPQGSSETLRKVLEARSVCEVLKVSPVKLDASGGCCCLVVEICGFEVWALRSHMAPGAWMSFLGGVLFLEGPKQEKGGHPSIE